MLCYFIKSNNLRCPYYYFDVASIPCNGELNMELCEEINYGEGTDKLTLFSKFSIFKYNTIFCFILLDIVFRKLKK